MVKMKPATVVVTVSVCVEVGLEVSGKVPNVLAEIVSDWAIAGSDANKINRTYPATLLTIPPYPQDSNRSSVGLVQQSRNLRVYRLPVPLAVLLLCKASAKQGPKRGSSSAR